MGIKDLISKFVGDKESLVLFEAIPDSMGINFVIDQKSFDGCKQGGGSPFLTLQYTYLQMLMEQGGAEPLVNGFFVPSNIAVALDDDEEDDGAEELLGLPPRFNGSFETRIEGETFKSTFNVKLIPVTKNGDRVPNYRRKGPILSLSANETYRLRPEEYAAVSAVEDHQQNDSGNVEDNNLWLIGELQKARSAGMQIDLSHFREIDVEHPEKIGLTAVGQADGSLLLGPNFGVGVEADDFESRKWQLGKSTGGKAALRIKDKIVVLDEKKLEATREVLDNRHIPSSQVKEFLKAPSAFIDASLVDLDMGFSIRVKGATKFTFMEFGQTDESGIRWFEGEAGAFVADVLLDIVCTEEQLSGLKEGFIEAQKQGADQMIFAEKLIDIKDRNRVNEIINDIQNRFQNNIYPSGNQSGESGSESERATVDVVQAEDISENLREIVERVSCEPNALDFSSYKRSPYPHQEAGIQWFVDLAIEAMKSDLDDLSRLQGALLADDMGLGKTYMALVGIAEIYKYLEKNDKTCKPVLVVAPLSLLENWEDEVSSTFEKSPFDDIVVLQSARDLKSFKKKGAGSEVRQAIVDDESLSEDAIRFSLNIGKHFGSERLDNTKRLVLTTYQTLRDYQFSLCMVDWSVVVFDETQNIKNPNTLQTRAAKGLKADFKLHVTGTPVENSLIDFWCIMDTAQPGLLGSWPEFREKYVAPITSAELEEEAKVRADIGKQLRDDVGHFMLRRLKEDSLKGLPKKNIFTGLSLSNQTEWIYQESLSEVMDGEQLRSYDMVLSSYQSTEVEDRRVKALATLQKLRQLSLHPNLHDERALCSSSKNEAEEYIFQSGKLATVVKLLHEIRRRDEKVLIFLINKKLQRLLKIWLQQIFDMSVEIINGDTKAVSKTKGSLTRKGIITEFESKPGFGILIMSPVAAGVGLTVVGANNVIHLERHWNPAKEAQATDRVYRIGQKKDVNIYLPTLLHPERQSFDVNLDKLLSNKISLKDAVVTPQVVTSDDLGGVFGV